LRRRLGFPRGSVLGPLVVAGISMRERQVEELRRLGVRDSKRLTPPKREMLDAKLREMGAKTAFVRIQPQEIDETVLRGKRYRKLNFLEAKAMAIAITELRPSVAFVDASDVSCERFRRQILQELRFKIPIISEHRADQTYPIVSAASILAKVERDRCIRSISRRWGDIGSGYPSDEKTLTFLNEILSRKDAMPTFIRGSWKTVRRILEQKGTKNHTQPLEESQPLKSLDKPRTD